MVMTREEIAAALARQCRTLYERGLTYSTGGNASHRHGDGFLISASGTSFGALSPDDLVPCDLAATPLEHRRRPSKETPFHAAIYRKRPEVQAIMHLHAPASTALSCLAAPTDDGNVLPVVTAYAAMRVGRVPLIEYVAPGTQALSDRIEAVAGTGPYAMLLQNHGLITVGESVEEAAGIAEEAEMAIRIWMDTFGAARVLSDEDLEKTPMPASAPIAPGTQRPSLLRGVAFGAFKSWSR